MSKNVRLNPETGTNDYYFPMEVKDDSVLTYAREYGYEVGWARLGFRKFLAVFVPCKEQVTDSHGRITFLDTPSDVQRRRYLAYIKDEMDEQEDAKQDGRCNIPDGHGGIKRCPCRIANPDYVPGGDKPKTIPVKCEGCVYEQFRQAHTTVELSCLDHENEAGEMEPYEVPAPRSNYAGDRYEELAEAFIAFVRERKPKLAALAELKVNELNLTEAAKELDKAISTVDSQTKKLEELVTEFLDNAIIF
jgi:hypothetical protein